LAMLRAAVVGQTVPIYGKSKQSKWLNSNEYMDIRCSSDDYRRNAIIRIDTATKKADFISQVGFRLDKNSMYYEYYDFKTLKKNKKLLKDIADKIKPFKNDSKRIILIAQSPSEYKEMSKKLYIGDIKLMQSGGQSFLLSPKGIVQVIIRMNINEIILRAIAKIAFNYFASIAPKRLGSNYIYRNDFDDIRRYVREGINTQGARFIEVSNNSMLYGESKLHKYPNYLHNITIDSDGFYIIVQVKLFNSIIYKVRLNNKPLKIGVSISAGEAFDFFNKKVHILLPKKSFDLKGIILPKPKL